MRLFYILFLIFLPHSLLGLQENYNSKMLKTKDYEEMRALLKKHIKKSQTEVSDIGEDVDSAIWELKKGLKVLLMRPDTDSIKSSLILSLQNEIIKYRSFMGVFREVVEEALSEFKSQTGTVAYQASLLYLIENSVSYLKSINNKDSSAILQSIKTANLKIPKKIFSYLLLEMGRGRTASPSYLAKQILNQRLAEQQKIAKEQAKKDKQAKKQAKKDKQAKKTKAKKKREPSSQKDSSTKTINIDF